MPNRAKFLAPAAPAKGRVKTAKRSAAAHPGSPSDPATAPPAPAIPPRPRARKTRSDGRESREAILTAAAKLASVRGFEALSIGALASELGMSKSGLFAHFGSKDELELATIAFADGVFRKDVISRVQHAKPGLARLATIVDAYFDHVQSGYFPGGCFFAAVAAEVVAKPGRRRDEVLTCIQNWQALLQTCFDEARALRELRPKVDIPQAAFEVHAMLSAANSAFVLSKDPKVFARARQGVERITERVKA